MTGRELWHRCRDLSWVRSQVADLGLMVHSGWSRSEFARAYRAVRPYTMCGPVRLRALHRAVQYAVASNVPGSLVECGTARGGSAALMGLAAAGRGGARRPLWVFDTFDGLPEPSEGDADRAAGQAYVGRCRGSVGEVEALFGRLGILSDARLVKGLLEETVAPSAVGDIAVLHLDCDWFRSVAVCLEHLYDRVSPGGVIQIDDYGHWAGARRAVDEFLAVREIRSPLRVLDYSGRQLVKPDRR